MVKSALAALALSCLSCAVLPPATAQESNPTSAKTVAKKRIHKKSSTRHHARKAASHTAETEHDGSLDPHEKLVRKVVVSHGKRRVVYHRVARQIVPAVPPVLSAGELAGLNATHDPLDLRSNVALVLDEATSQVLLDKNSDVALPIASITKLMTALVVVEAHQDMDEVIEVTTDDIDHEKNTSSRLRIGSKLSRANMLHIALMSSENRAASALGRNYPGGLPAFVAAMNAKAKALGMNDTHYVDSTGLSSHNVASARDLAKLVVAAHEYPILCQYSTDQKYMVTPGHYSLQYANSNHLVSNPDWDIGLQKTGFINEAGRCLVMQAKIAGRAVVMVFLDSKGKMSRIADASRIRKWLNSGKFQEVTHSPAVASAPDA
ncbi:MAG: D-alanyl-D-alanine endopeptidase [Burkholderiaceae bacterium]